MGSFDGVEVCELVGLYLLDILKSDFSRKSIDGLSYFENKSGPKLEKIKKRVCKSFKDNGLNITIETYYRVSRCIISFKNWKVLSV